MKLGSMNFSGRLAGTAFLAMALIWATPAWSVEIIENIVTTINDTQRIQDHMRITDSTINMGASGDLTVDKNICMGNEASCTNGSRQSGSGTIVNMQAGSKLTAGNLYANPLTNGRHKLNFGTVFVEGETFFYDADVNFFGELKVYGSQIEGQAGRGARFDNSKVYFHNHVLITGEELGFDNFSQANLAAGKELEVIDGELWIEHGSEFIMGQGSFINVARGVLVSGEGEHGFSDSTLKLLGNARINSGNYNAADLLSFAGISKPVGFLVAPGGHVDVGLHTFTVEANTYFMADSTYKLSRNNSATGLISVTGDATFEDGVNIIIDGFSSSNAPILTATGNLDVGSINNSFYNFSVSGNGLLATFQGTNAGVDSIISAAGGSTTNYANAKELIGKFTNNASVSDVLKGNLLANIQRIEQLDDPALVEKALKQLVGEEALTAASAQHNTMSQMNAALGGRFQTLLGNSPPAAGYGLAENRLWVGGFGQWNRQKDADNVFGYEYNAGGVMLGYDREITGLPGLTVGLYGSLADGTLKNNSGFASTDIRSMGLGLYGLYEFSGGFFLDASLGYGHSDNDATIDLVLGGRKTSEFSSDSFQTGFNLGYTLQLSQAVSLTPSAGLRFTRTKQNSWEEKIVSDPDNVAVANWFGDSRQNFLEIPLNLKLAAKFEAGGGATVSPELRLGGVIMANDPKSELRMGFVGSSDSAVISGISPGKSRFVAGTGVKAQINDSLDIFAGYDLEARSGYKGHSVSAGLGFSF